MSADRIPWPTGEIRRTVLVTLPENGRPYGGVHCPDHEILLEELGDLDGYGSCDGPLINGLIAVGLEHDERRGQTDAELVDEVLHAVHRALERSAVTA